MSCCLPPFLSQEEIEYYVHFLQGNLDDSAGKQALMDGLQHHKILQAFSCQQRLKIAMAL